MMRQKTLKSIILRTAVIISASVVAVALLFLVAYILIKGVPHLKLSLFSFKYTSDNVSLFPALVNTLFIAALSLAIAIPLGVGSAIYLTEYTGRGNKIVNIIRITAETLSGVPSIVYGLFGSIFFVKFLGLGLSLLSGALTLSIMILPLIMRTTEEALRSVPDSFREGSYGLGAGKLRTITRIVIPSAANGILSGVILSVGRIFGESAALIFTAGTVAKVATNLSNSARTLSVHLYALSGEGLHIEEAYAAAVVLLIVVVVINMLSSLIGRRIGGKNG